MRKIKKVEIDGFWGDKKVILNFNNDINFLIGVNGSGKTTIINLIAACLKADFTTLDKADFDKIKVFFFPSEKEVKDGSYIEIEKKEKEDSPYPNIIFKIKLGSSTPTTLTLNDLEEDYFFRTRDIDYMRRRIHLKSGRIGSDIYFALKEIVNLTWLSIHRTTKPIGDNDKSFESSIDHKVKELSTDLVKYFGVLDKNYSLETEKFQKNIFLSLIEDETDVNVFEKNNLDSEKEKDSLKQIFLLFKLKENEFSDKLDKHFKSYVTAQKELESKVSISLNSIKYILGTRRIHSIVQEWAKLNDKKNLINKPKETFISEINNLFQRKEIFINEKNELLVKTQSGKCFTLNNLSSGEKQLLIILGESLLQESSNHIYIADEPELSLHVEWQEKLVSSLKKVNPNSQIIFATHSPDIVGQFSNAIIKVENCIK